MMVTKKERKHVSKKENQFVNMKKTLLVRKRAGALEIWVLLKGGQI